MVKTSPLALEELVFVWHGGSSILMFDAPANNDKRFGRDSLTWPQLNTSDIEVDIRCKSTFIFIFFYLFDLVSLMLYDGVWCLVFYFVC